MSSESNSPVHRGILGIVIRISLPNNGGGASWNEWEEICFLSSWSCRGVHANTWLTERSLETSLKKQIQMSQEKNKCVLLVCSELVSMYVLTPRRWKG